MILESKFNYPRVLVISHNCFSKSGSNGRTLANFFIKWPKKSLAQFYISNEVPDSPVCDNYFRVLDTEALKAFYKGSRVGQVINSEMNADGLEEDASLHALYKRHRKKTPFNYIARNLIWDSNRWDAEAFKKWIDDFNPELVLLQVGDYSFMFKIALRTAKYRKIPLILYNGEDYYFKDRKSISLLYHFYRFQYKRQFEKLMAYASHAIYSCNMLQDTYNKVFNHRSSVLFTTSTIKTCKNKRQNDIPIVSYLGNLGVGRHVPLIEIAETLMSIDESLRLDVYGKILNSEVKNAFSNCKAIRYHGFVSYEEVVEIMYKSELLVHAENFSDFYQWDLKHAFSTKIADSLASGTCLFVYGPESIASIKYLKNNKAAYVVTNKKDLNESLRKLMDDKGLRQSYIDTALQVANSRHNVDVNAEGFKNIVCGMTKKVSETK